MTCLACDGTGGRELLAEERMFGFGGQFRYRECGACGSLTLLDVPEDLGRYYPPDYYSFADTPPVQPGRLGRFLRRRRYRHACGRFDPVGWAVARLTGVPVHNDWVRRAGVDADHRILDVGCGSGGWLHMLAKDGFTRLSGIDPFLPADVHHPNGVRLWKRTLADTEGQFDFVLLSHALEHIADPVAALAHVRRLLAPGGACLVRTPVVAEAWDVYGPYWVQLDAPRHLFVGSERGLRRLAERAGFRVDAVVYDSSEFQFVGSERYRAGLTGVSAGACPPSPAEIAGYRRRAAALNAQGRGDQAMFYLRPAPPPDREV